MYSPYIKQDEPLKTECQHFLDCIRQGTTPLTSGAAGLEVVKILEASSESSKKDGAPIYFVAGQSAGTSSARPSAMVGSALVPTDTAVTGAAMRE
jgi:hypothetical protein